MIPSPNQITGPDHGGIGSMIEYKVYRIEDDQTRTEISTHDSLLDGTIAAATIVEDVDFDYAYEVRTGNGVAASFATGRIGYRRWAMSTGRISPSLEDRYDHDVDELLM